MVIKYEQFIFKNPWALLKEIGLNLRWSKVCLAWYDYLLDQRMLDNIRLHDFLKLASSIFKFNYNCTFHLVIKWQTIEYDWKKWNKYLLYKTIKRYGLIFDIYIFTYWYTQAKLKSYTKIHVGNANILGNVHGSKLLGSSPGWSRVFEARTASARIRIQ